MSQGDSMENLAGKRVLVTGAARGIGLAIAHEMAGEGAELVLTDVDEEGLDTAAAELRTAGVTVHSRVVDVASRDEVEDLAAWVVDELGGLDVLVNNAGIGYSAELAETSLETWKRLLDVNLWGVLHHVYAFLPHMRERRFGHIVNVSSGQAFLRLPTWGAYAAVKAAVGAFSEILHFELRKYGIGVTTVYPYMVNTGFYEGIQGKTWAARLSMKLVPYYSMSPEAVARIVVRAVKRNSKVERTSLINELGFLAQVVPFANDIISRGSNFLLARGADKEAA